MNLILWRHAEAEDANPSGDLARALTNRGRAQASAVAQWLNTRLPAHETEEVLVLVSPAVRTRQTAEALSRRVQIESRLSPDRDVADVLSACGWPRGPAEMKSGPKTVIVVGHQPTMGQTAALLLTGAPLPLSVKKGAFWWFQHRDRDGYAQTVLRAALAPEMLM